ncbi:MAG TPA: anti-sigma factor [Candidatus Acidoferrales bacterium]|jgi:anti-sigma-K factor RskA|nr:anti-sigma factor [Candidatus Acidoferrales bacterium]
MNGHPTRPEDFDLHALGALDAEEAQAFDAHLAACPECARKAVEARGRMALLSLAAPLQSPSPAVKQRLMRQIREDAPASRLSQEASSASGRWWAFGWATAAAALAAITIFLWIGNNRMRMELEALREATRQEQIEIERSRALVALLSAPDRVDVSLAPSAEAPGAQARVLYSASEGLVFSAENLPAAPEGKTYQLWLVPTSGNPISAGVFHPNAAGKVSILLPPLPPGVAAKAFAVTVEPAGGVPQPTGPKVLIGGVS